MKQFKFILSGGGTVGHINPALAIAKELRFKYPNCKILFVGAKGRMEMKIIPSEGFKIIGLWISGYVRKKITQNILLPFKLIVSFFQSLFICVNFKPDLIIGTGGYASFPILFTSSILRLPTILQEQNSNPGLSNRFLSKRANLIFVAYDNMERFFPPSKILNYGNPIRHDILNKKIDRNKSLKYFNLNPENKTIGVLGGSLGAKEINDLVLKLLPYFKKQKIQVIWQFGKRYIDKIDFPKFSLLKTFPFMENMNYLYNACDLIISRAGAFTISELCYVAKPCILFPSSNVTDNHQLRNAIYMERKGAAKVINSNTSINDIKKIINQILNSKIIQSKMIIALKKNSKSNVAMKIVNKIDKEILNG